MHFRSFALGIAASVSLAAAVAVAQNKSLDDLILANVNGEEITRRQLVARLLEYQGESTLERMVNRSLLLQAAKKNAVVVSEADTDKKIEQIKKQFKSDQEFQRFLTQNSLSEKQYRDEVRHTIMLERVALKESPITDQDLQQYEVRMLVAPTKAVAEQWIKELDGGADFAKLAAERNSDPNLRQAGGRMQPFLKIALLDVWRAVDEQKLKPGTYTKTPTLLNEGTWAIIKLENVVPVAAVSASEKERFVQLITRYRMDQWLQQARQTAKVAYPVPLATVIEPKK
jgi:foldase protein PrsA